MREMKKMVDDLGIDLRLAMQVPPGGYASTQEVPVVTVPRLLCRYLWSYLDLILTGAPEAHKKQYLDDLLMSVRDEDDEADDAEIDEGDDLGPVEEMSEDEPSDAQTYDDLDDEETGDEQEENDVAE